MDTTTDHFTPLALRVRGNNCVQHVEPQHFLKFKYYNQIVVLYFIFNIFFDVFNVFTTACNINIHVMRESPDFTSLANLVLPAVLKTMWS